MAKLRCVMKPDAGVSKAVSKAMCHIQQIWSSRSSCSADTADAAHPTEDLWDPGASERDQAVGMVQHPVDGHPGLPGGEHSQPAHEHYPAVSSQSVGP